MNDPKAYPTPRPSRRASTGVKTKPLRLIPDERGWLMEILRADDRELFARFGQVYVSATYPGVVKAWHYHKVQTDNFACVVGHGEAGPGRHAAGLADRGRGQRVLHRRRRTRCWSRCRTWSTTAGSASATSAALVVNVPTELYDYDEPDEFRLEPHGTLPVRLEPERWLRSSSPAAPGFIGSNFVRHALAAHPDWRVTTLDKLTYAGHLENLHDVMDDPRHTFVHGDIADAARVAARWSSASNIVVHFAAETHVDRSILAAGDFIRTDVFGTFVLLEAAREAPGSAPLRPDLDRRGLRQRADGREPRDRRAEAAQPVLGEQGGRRPAGLQLLGHLRRAGDHHARLEQLRAVPVPREAHPAVRHQRARRPAGAALRRRPERARLAARARSLPRRSTW